MEPDNQNIKTRPSDGDPSTAAPITPARPVSAPVAPANNDTPLPTPPTGTIPADPAKEAVPETVPVQTTPVPTKELTIEEKLEAARVAMEGPDRSAERIKRETEAKVEEETHELSEEKAVLDKKKEKLELAWIDLDSKRGVFKKELDPILAEEEKIESEERTAETEEEAAGLPAQKQAAEKKRQEKDAARKAVEEKKWVIQDKIAKIEVEIEANTKEYQTLLDEEEKILQKIDDLKKELL